VCENRRFNLEGMPGIKEYQKGRANKQRKKGVRVTR
jgi:hypothetical protein